MTEVIIWSPAFNYASYVLAPEGDIIEQDGEPLEELNDDLGDYKPLDSEVGQAIRGLQRIGRLETLISAQPQTLTQYISDHNIHDFVPSVLNSTNTGLLSAMAVLKIQPRFRLPAQSATADYICYSDVQSIQAEPSDQCRLTQPTVIGASWDLKNGQIGWVVSLNLWHFSLPPESPDDVLEIINEVTDMLGKGKEPLEYDSTLILPAIDLNHNTEQIDTLLDTDIGGKPLVDHLLNQQLRLGINDEFDPIEDSVNSASTEEGENMFKLIYPLVLAFGTEDDGIMWAAYIDDPTLDDPILDDPTLDDPSKTGEGFGDQEGSPVPSNKSSDSPLPSPTHFLDSDPIDMSSSPDSEIYSDQDQAQDQAQAQAQAQAQSDSHQLESMTKKGLEPGYESRERVEDSRKMDGESRKMVEESFHKPQPDFYRMESIMGPLIPLYTVSRMIPSGPRALEQSQNLAWFSQPQLADYYLTQLQSQAEIQAFIGSAQQINDHLRTLNISSSDLDSSAQNLSKETRMLSILDYNLELLAYQQPSEYDLEVMDYLIPGFITWQNPDDAQHRGYYYQLDTNCRLILTEDRGGQRSDVPYYQQLDYWCQVEVYLRIDGSQIREEAGKLVMLHSSYLESTSIFEGLQISEEDEPDQYPVVVSDSLIVYSLIWSLVPDIRYPESLGTVEDFSFGHHQLSILSQGLETEANLLQVTPQYSISSSNYDLDVGNGFSMDTDLDGSYLAMNGDSDKVSSPHSSGLLLDSESEYETELDSGSGSGVEVETELNSGSGTEIETETGTGSGDQNGVEVKNGSGTPVEVETPVETEAETRVGSRDQNGKIEDKPDITGWLVQRISQLRGLDSDSIIQTEYQAQNISYSINLGRLALTIWREDQTVVIDFFNPCPTLYHVAVHNHHTVQVRFEAEWDRGDLSYLMLIPFSRAQQRFEVNRRLELVAVDEEGNCFRLPIFRSNLI